MADNITYAEMNLTSSKGKGQGKTNSVQRQDEDLTVTYAAVKKPPGKKKEKSSKRHKVLDPPQSEDVAVMYAAINKKMNPKLSQKDSAGGKDVTVTYAALRGTTNKKDGPCEEKSPWDTGVTVRGDQEQTDWRQRLFPGIVLTPGRCRSLVLVPSLVALCLVLLITTIVSSMTCKPRNESGSAAGMTCRPGNGSGSAADFSSLCPDPWILLTNKCYYFSDNRKNQKESREDCENRNSRLATVKKGTILKLVNITEQEFWIGLESRGTEHNGGTWSGRWADGSVVNVTKGSGSCAKIGHDLRLSYCQTPLPWICERDVLDT